MLKCSTDSCISASLHEVRYVCVFFSVDSSYREGDIRLVGGPYNWEGRVEIYWSGTWTALSDSSWTSSDAKVVCRQLGHSTEGSIIHCV